MYKYSNVKKNPFQALYEKSYSKAKVHKHLRKHLQILLQQNVVEVWK